MAEGFHEVKYEDGDHYKGQWNADGKRHGLGVLNFADGSCYKGQFSRMNSGSGVLEFQDRSKYEGSFANGHYEGFGIFTKGDGMKYEGEFREGKVSGAGKVTFPDGTSGRPRQEGTFQDRKLVTGGKQASAVKQAQDAAAEARNQANAADALKG